MANKYWWRDEEDKTEEQNATNVKSQTENKYWWRDEDNTTQSQQSSGNKYWWRTESAAADITDRVNNWLKNHNTYITNYQTRYSGRKGNYEDDYVWDSDAWLDTVSQQKSNFDAEADAILSYLDQHKDYLDADWVSQVKSTIQSAQSTQNQILDSSTKDKQYWDSWGSEDFVKEYGSAKEAYKAHQLFDANAGKTTTELDEILAKMEDGKEKEWLTSYRSSVERDEMGKYDLVAGAKEIEELERVADEMATISNQYYFATNSSIYSEEEASEIIAKYNALVSQYGTPEEFHANLNKKKEYLEKAKDVQELNNLTGFADPTSELYDPEFSKYAEMGAAIENPTFKDAYGTWIGPWQLGGDDIGNIVTFTRDNYIDIMSSTEGGKYKTVGNPLYNYMEEDEVKLYNYLLAKEKEIGDEYKGKASSYLSYLEPMLKKRMGKSAASQLTSIDIPVLEDLAVISSGLAGGVEQWINNTGSYFTGEKADPSVLQYTNASLSESLDGIGYYAHQAATTVGNMAPSILVGYVFGPVAGSATLSVSAAGGAYTDALAKGYDKNSARTYGNLVGAAEGTLQYLIGGIGALGGVSGKIAGGTAKLASKVAAIDNSLLRVAAKLGLKGLNLGLNIGSEIIEEELQNYLEPAFRTIIFGEDYDAPTMDELIETAIVTALSTGSLEGISTNKEVNKQVNDEISLNNEAIKKYGNKTDTLINQGLQNDVDSKSYQLATKYQQKVQGKDGKNGKALTGQQIRNLLAANQDAITDKDMQKIQQAAEGRLTELGQTGDVAEIAKLATKYATGSELTRAEKKLLANSEYGSRVASELLPNHVLSDLQSSEWARNIGTKSVNALAYNIKSIVEQMANMDKPATYKSLEERVGEEEKFNVSETGKATISGTDTEVDLSKPEIVEFIKDKDGKVTDLVLNVGGKKVKASEIDFADGDQSYLYSAVKHIENITPGDATVFVRDYDPSSGLSVGEYLNGIDEAYTYGYHNYSEADMGAGQFAPKISSEKAKGAYELGKITKSKSDTSKSEAIKRMRTAVEAEVEKAKVEGKEAPKAKQMTITYRDKSGKLASIKEIGIRPGLQSGGIKVAEILHKLGLGTNFEFFTSYESKSLKDKKGNPARVYIDENGVETAAPSGVYRLSDGTIRIDLNAYNGRQLTLNALAHELTHFIQQWSDEKYKVLADFLMKTYEQTGMTMHQRVLREQARLEGIRGKAVSYNEAYDEVVANAMMKMFDDGKLVERLTELKATDEKLARKLWEGFKRILKKFLGLYQGEDALFHDTADLMQMKDAFEQLQNMFAEALVEASENFQANLIAKEAGLDIMPVEDGVQYSYSSLAEAAGFEAVQNEDGTRSFVREGKKVSKVTVEDIDNSPIGAFINFSLEMGDISKADADRQKQMFADICTMACKTNDFAMTMQFVGSAVFTGMKANADKQYGTTYDFPSICTKTQAVIDAMSAKMVKLGRGLNTNEIVQLYDDVFASGNPVPCPECYVFSRWIGIGGLLDNIKKYQDYYGDMAIEDVAAEYQKMKAEVAKFAEEQGISFGKAKGALTAKLTKEFNKLTEKIEKAQNQGEKVKPADKQRLAELEPMMNTVKGMTWLENVYFADSSLKKVNPNFRVPDSILFDLNNGEAFATQYKEAWAFRTTQGAGYGKAITPYAEARLGEGVLVTNNTTNAIKGRAQGTLDNYFLQQMGKLDKKSRDALKRARLKQKIQAFIGGQRFQSTSDARYENASDYLLAALEMQAMGGMVQVYTKVDGAVPAFSAWGFSINQSLMPLNGGLDADGNVVDTPVGGMKPSVAFDNRNKHETAGTITIGVNDNHIRAMFKQLVRDFIIPYHASGGKADTIAEFRRIQEGKEAKGKAVRSTDYSRTQSDKVLSDEVLRWQGKTDAQIQRIHEIRNARIAILTGGNPNMTVVRSNRFLSALYDKLNGGEWDGVKLAKSKVESQIYPNEFWDQTVTYEESAKITKDYLEYCEDLGFLHRFSGMIPSNGKLVPANGYNENGERVQLTDLAYKYDANGNKTAEVEEFFWKVLTDRRMYDNNGKYLAQKVVTLNDTTTDTVTGFAKNNQGREYDKAKAEALAKKIVGEQYSSQETDADKNKNRVSSDSPLTRRSVKQRSVGSTHIKMSSTAAAEILGIENIANYSDSVKEAITVLGEFFAAIDQKKLVAGFSKPITASNLEGSLVAKNILKRGGFGGSAYRYDNGHALRISNHSAKSENFKGKGEHLSLVLYEKGKLNDFEEAESNVIEAVFKHHYLDRNPEVLKRVIHDIAHFIAKGEYHDTAGAMRYNFSGTEKFKKMAEKRMARDSVVRERRDEVLSSQETDADAVINSLYNYDTVDNIDKAVINWNLEYFAEQWKKGYYSSVIDTIAKQTGKAKKDVWNAFAGVLMKKVGIAKMDGKTYINVHELNEDNLRKAFELGGLAAPSIGIVDVDNPVTHFGDIALIFPDIFSPESNPTYYGDSYSSSFPAVGSFTESTMLEDALTYGFEGMEWSGILSHQEIYDLIDELDQVYFYDESQRTSHGISRDGFANAKEFARNYNIKSIPGLRKLYDGLQERYDSYEAFLEDFAKKVFTNKRMHRTYTGNSDFDFDARRYQFKDYSLENVVDEMTADGDKDFRMALGEKVTSSYDLLSDGMRARLKSGSNNFYEVKPQRAVYFDEATYAVVPENTSADVIEMLESEGVKVVEYQRKEGYNGVAEGRAEAIKEILESDTTGIRYSTQDTDVDNVGYHAGDLGKAEGYWNMVSSNRSTGHFGTGTYFVGDEVKINDSTYGNRPHEKVDFSKYHLYRPVIESDGFDLHSALKYINDNIFDYPIARMGFDELWDVRKQAEKAEYTIWDDDATDAEKAAAQKILDDFKERFKRVNYDPNRMDAQELYEELNDITKEYRLIRSKLEMSFWRDMGGLSYEEQNAKIDSIMQGIYNEVSQIEDAYSARYEDSPSTRFVKAMGYEGIDVRGFKGLDNTSYGSVIYDLKGEDLARKKEVGTARYSTQETDNISNRDLLANAFETLSRSSIEYEMIQDYRKQIKLQNLLDEQLSDLNAEIHEMRFTKDKYDAEKLRKLEEKAKRIANDINKIDMTLLNMETAEPLRKLIQRERKIATEQTKAHVKEIQQNKKARAEQTELRHKIRKAVRDLDKILNRGNKKQNVKEDMQSFVSKALELADYLFTDHISNDDLIRKGITVRMTAREEALVKETEDILTQLYDNADSLTDEEFARLDAKRKANEDKLRDLLTSQRNERLNTPVYNLFNDLVTEYAALKNSKQEAVKGAYDPKVEEFLRSYLGENVDGTDSDRKTLLQNMRVADMTTEELWKLYNAYTMVLHSVRTANKLFVNGKLESLDQTVEAIVTDFGKRKIPEGKVAIALRNISNKFGWNYEKLYYALDRIGSESFTELIMNLANSENTVMQDIIEAVAFRDKIVEDYGFNNWDVNKKIDKEFLDNTGKKFSLTLGQLMSLYAYSRREGAWDHIEYGGFVFGEKALTDPRPADSYKLSKEQCEAITNTLTKEQKGYVEDMQKFLSETMGAKGNEVSMLLYGIKMFGEKNYFPIHIAGQYKAQANESQAKAAAGFGTMSNAGFTHAQNPNAKAPFVLEGFNEVWSDHVNEMSRYHGTVPALEDLRRVMNRSSYSDSLAESMSVKAMMENAFGQEAVDYFDNLYREANSGDIHDRLQKWPKKRLSLFRKNSVAYSLSVLIQQPASMVRAYALIDRKYFGFKGVGALTSGVAKAVSSKWNPAYANAYNEMLKYAPGVTMAKEIGGFDTHTGSSIRKYLLDTGKSFKQSMKTENLAGKGKAVMGLVDDNAIANLPNVADKIAWIEIWNACKRETVAKHKDLATNSDEFMNIVGERFTEVIRATQVYDSMFSKSPMLKSKNLAVQYLVSFMNEPNTVANMVEGAVRDVTRGNWKQGAKTAAVVVHSIIFTNVLKSIVYAMRDDDEDESYIEKYIEAITGGMMDDFWALNYIPLVRDVWSVAQGYDVERADMAIVSDAVNALGSVIKNTATKTEDMTEEELVEFDKKATKATWDLVGSVAAFFGIPVKNIRREIEGVIDHARIASANAGQTTELSVWDKISESVIESIPFLSTKESKTDKLYDAIVSGDTKYIERIKGTYKTKDAYQNAVRKALRENDPRIKAAAQDRYDGNMEEYKRIFREIQNEGKFTFDDIMSAVNSEVSAIKKGVEPEKATSDYTATGYVEAIAMGNTTEAQAMKDDIIASKVANGKTQEEAEKEFKSSVATGIRDAYYSGLLDEARAEKMLVEYAGKDEEEAASKVNYWSFCEEHPEYADALSESNVNDYQEFAEPANIPLDVFVQYVEGTKGLVTIKDKWGDVEKSVRDQTLEVIDSLPLTWQQKDALYLAAGYSESKIWDVPW